MRITIDIDESDATRPAASVQTARQEPDATAALPTATAPDAGPTLDTSTAIDAGPCADPTAAAFLAAEGSASGAESSATSAGAAPAL